MPVLPTDQEEIAPEDVDAVVIVEEDLDEDGVSEYERLMDAIDFLVGKLDQEANRRINYRNITEQRWLEDLRQYNGDYDSDILTKLVAANRSTLFINETRPQTNAAAARLYDMLFPTDDKNWAIMPTPLPEMESNITKMERATNEGIRQAEGQGQDPNENPELVALKQKTLELKKIRDEAKLRSQFMSDEIEDQLIECNYQSKMRDAIDDACLIGTGIIKGPIKSSDDMSKQWVQKPVLNEYEEVVGQEWMLDTKEESTPRMSFYRVDPWNFFPEPGATCIEESESTFELHLMKRKDMQELARRPGFNEDAIRNILKNKIDRDVPNFLTELRDLTGENQSGSEDRMYQVWEYRGAMESSDIQNVCACLGRDDIEVDEDPLSDIQIELWFCQGEVIRFEEHYLDSGESIYSVYNLEKVRGSFWGYGIPRIMRDQQSAMNGAWRMLMDNSGLSTGPQLEIDTSVIEPANGDWSVSARKIWLRKATADAAKPGIRPIDIPNHQGELTSIIQLTKAFIDNETSISSLAKGEQGSHTTTTANGMAMLMNAVNVVFRRFVKNFDDDMTVSTIRRAYHWEMQFSDRDEIKGDFNVDARGSSVLLVRELQAQNLMVLANMTAHPAVGLLLKAAPIMRKLSQSMMIHSDDIIKTDEELKLAAEKAAEAEQGQQQQDIEQMKLQAQMQAAQMKQQTEMQIAQLDSQTKLQVAQISAQGVAHKNESAREGNQIKAQMKQMDNMNKAQLEQLKIDSEERKLAAEIAIKERYGQGL